MQTATSSVLLDVPQAAAIWLALLGVAAVAVTALVVRPDLFRSVIGGRFREAAMPSRLEQAAEDRERHRYAGEVATAAERAAATAQRLRAEWLSAQEEVETVWQACEVAEDAVRRLAAAAGLPRPHTERTPAEYADRERYLHRAALDAYWRRELSEEQLSDVFAHRNGWDPRLHPVEQELVLHRAVRDHLRTRQQAAREREQAAWRAAEQAVVAARSLREEAFAATAPAEPEQPLLPGVTDGRSPAAEQTREMPVLTTREVPTVTRDLPTVAAGLPTVTRDLPAVAAGLPTVARGRAAVTRGRSAARGRATVPA
ncbi:hypothetical protein OOK41_30915 [Micromonospora sp. NBC_01655]|uniref:hypothetical protein n=1 Tax=Micromonospora sp. NBC_01655 TaxID=2975983 RepID=UPI00224E5201|nr:hypothetical protein [Micromonospora sp. NBC_01655]MCX4474672.1 hypothetical protein [Micromonospora sp. NBC_01655]